MFGLHRKQVTFVLGYPRNKYLCLGLRGMFVSLFRSYMANKPFIVRLNGKRINLVGARGDGTGWAGGMPAHRNIEVCVGAVCAHACECECGLSLSLSLCVCACVCVCARVRVCARPHV